jgi:uncharacterized surface protein with fasciclin (FAS1) repeats
MLNMNRRILLKTAAASGMLLPCAGRVRAQVPMVDAYTLAITDPRFTIWARLIDIGGLQAAARSPNAFTVFAPTDEAFSKHPEVQRMLLEAQRPNAREMDVFPDTSRIVGILRAHVIRGKHMLSEFQGKKVTLTSVAGVPLLIDGTGPQVTVTRTDPVSGKTVTLVVTDTPMLATNAVIYPVNDAMISTF